MNSLTTEANVLSDIFQVRHFYDKANGVYNLYPRPPVVGVSRKWRVFYKYLLRRNSRLKMIQRRRVYVFPIYTLKYFPFIILLFNTISRNNKAVISIRHQTPEEIPVTYVLRNHHGYVEFEITYQKSNFYEPYPRYS